MKQNLASAGKGGGFGYCGVIEGFYGAMWAHEERLDLVSRMAGWAMNLYVYAPKTDPYHRFRWEVLYPKEAMRRFRELGDAARKQGVEFSLAISPGNSFRPGKKEHQAALLKKLGQFVDVGCRFFPILYDDLHGFSRFDTAEAAGHAQRQAEMMNGYAEAIGRRVKGARFLFCPTEYGTAEKSPYLTRLHEVLDPRVEVVCTGVDGPGYQVFAKTFSNAGARRYAENFGRKPFVWDNFNTSDWTLNELHWSAYQGRGDGLGELCAGILLNPQNVYRLNLPVFGAMGDWLKRPRGYGAAKSMKRELGELLGREGGRVGMVLSKWFTNEVSGYGSSDLNLPALAEGEVGGGGVRRLLEEIRRVVRPLAGLQEAFDGAVMPVEWAGELGGYCHLLKWWAEGMLLACEAGLARKAIGAEERETLRRAMRPLGEYGYQLPGSLKRYMEGVYARVLGG